LTLIWVFKSGLFAAALAAALASPPASAAAGEARAAAVDSCSALRKGDSWFGPDKARHFAASFILTGTVSRTLHVRGHESRRLSLAAGVGCTVSLGGLKEILDRRTGRGHASWKDMAANLLGAGCGALLLSWW
jgi:putative lipoprotein